MCCRSSTFVDHSKDCILTYISNKCPRHTNKYVVAVSMFGAATVHWFAPGAVIPGLLCSSPPVDLKEQHRAGHDTIQH